MTLRVCFVLLAVCLLGTARAQDFSVASAWRVLPAVTLQAQVSSAPMPQADAAALLFGPLPEGERGKALSVRLLTWSLPWVGAGVAGLWFADGERARGFWGMSAAWGLVNAGIAYAGLLGAEPEVGGLRTVLLVNAGLDVLYIAGGAYLLSRPEETSRGAGWAVIVQGAFLLIFDLVHALWALPPG